MNKTYIRVTLDNDDLGPLVIHEPMGCEEAALKLERHKEYHGVIESYEDTLVFHTQAIPYLQSIRAIGVDSQLRILIEVTDDYGATWETFFSGLTDVESLKELFSPTGFRMEGANKKTDLWSKFMNRIETEVNTSSTLDLDGVAVGAMPLRSVLFPSQTIGKTCLNTIHNESDPDKILVLYGFTAVNANANMDLPKVVYNEILNKFNLNPGTGPGPFLSNHIEPSLIDFEEPGDTGIKVDLLFSKGSIVPGPGYPFNKINAGATGAIVICHLGIFTSHALTRADLGVNGVDGCTRFSLDLPGITIVKGDQVSVSITNIAVETTYIVYGGLVVDPLNPIAFINSFIDIVQESTAQDSTVQAALLYDVADAILKRICGDSLHSNFLGGATQGYSEDGCGYPFVNLLGLNVRGFPIGVKNITRSFKDWFSGGIVPIFNLGLGLEIIEGVEKIVIDEVARFYDSSSNSIDFNYVKNITKGFRKDATFKSIKIGYNKYELSAGGSLIDDPQTQHTYAPPLKYVGVPVEKLSNQVAASLLTEMARRAIVKPNETFDTDNDLFIIKLQGDLTQPDLTGTTNLNSSPRYNNWLTPARNFLRWVNTFSVGLQQYLGGVFQFTGGVGNVTASIDIPVSDCSGTYDGPVIENANIPISENVTYGIEQIDFEFDLTWSQYKQIRDNKNKSIGVSITNTDHEAYFIDTIEFYLFERKAKFVLFRAV